MLNSNEKTYNVIIKRMLTKFKKMLVGPTAVWFYTYYLFTLLMMILTNISREGLSLDSIISGPKYYLDLIMYYGLNNIYLVNEPTYSEFTAFFIAPFFMIFFGLTLFFLKDAGFAINGGTPADPYGDLYNFFFDRPVYGADTYLGDHYKWNLFYFNLVIVPLVATIAATIIYNRKRLQKPNLLGVLGINYIIAWLITVQFCEVTGSVTFHWSNFLKAITT